jgi:hypothetical protein
VLEKKALRDSICPLLVSASPGNDRRTMKHLRTLQEESRDQIGQPARVSVTLRLHPTRRTRHGRMSSPLTRGMHWTRYVYTARSPSERNEGRVVLYPRIVRPAPNGAITYS